MSNLFMGKGAVSAIFVDNFIGKRKNFRLLISYGFDVLATSDMRRKETQRSKKNKRRKKTQKIGEEGKLENAEEAG